TVNVNGAVHFDLSEVPVALWDTVRDAVGNRTNFKAQFERHKVRDGEIYLSRTHPIVEGLASYVMDTALDAQSDAIAKRCGVARTGLVDTRTTLLLLRFRYHIITQQGGEGRALLAEDCLAVAFAGSPQN